VSKKPVTITLGERSWSVRPLTLGQVELIEPIISDPISSNMTKTIDALAVALRRDFPADAESVREIETTTTEAGAAFSAILRLGGYLPAEGQELGETEPAPETAG
jgi:hypothetical protein